MRPVIIVGSGLAGYNTLREFRRRAKEHPVLLVTGDAGDYYSKPSLSNALAEGRDAEALVLNSAEGMAASARAQIVTRSAVVELDTARRCVRLHDRELEYACLVLALGASPISPRLEGSAANDVISVNDLGDYRRFRSLLESSRRVVVLGAGLIGCEFANDLAGAGYRVDVVEVSQQALPRLLPSAAVLPLHDRLAAIGVRWHFGQAAVRLDRARAGYRLTLGDGRVLESDLVLSAIGLAPNTGLARAAGIEVRRGIVVDRCLATCTQDVYALGDCAEVEGLVLPFISPISHAARALGSTLAGNRTTVRYPAMPVRVKTPAWPMVVAPAAPGVQGSWECAPCRQGMRSLLRDGQGRLVAFALGGAAVEEAAALTRELPAMLD